MKRRGRDRIRDQPGVDVGRARGTALVGVVKDHSARPVSPRAHYGDPRSPGDGHRQKTILADRLLDGRSPGGGPNTGRNSPAAPRRTSDRWRYLLLLDALPLRARAGPDQRSARDGPRSP